ncbi:MAG TPA: endonuclease [Tepidisphaeraceae bacterium]
MKVWALRVAVATVVAASWAEICHADEFDAPASYYNGAVYNASAADPAADLKAKLHDIVTANFRPISYGQVDNAIPVLDRNLSSPTQIYLIYDDSRGSVAATSNVWNKEHIWAASLLRPAGSNSTPTHYSDLFNLRPANSGVNSNRGNRNFGGFSNTHTTSTTGQYSPGQFDRGDVARTMFYMTTRYSPISSSNATSLKLVNTDMQSEDSGSYQHGDLKDLLVYHYADLPDQFERRRNQLIYTGNVINGTNYSQNNRNPYIDHPEYVWAVFGDGANDSQIKLTNGTTTSAGGTSRSIEFTPVIVGGTIGTLSSNVGLNKTGADPTTYSVAAGGAATSGTNGIYNAFVAGASTADKSVTVGLNATAQTVGRTTGTVTVNNTDITNQGVGTGNADGDDVVTLGISVLDHAEPSFAGGGDLNALTIDFGDITLGQAATDTFDVWNVFAQLRAGLDLDSFAATGDTAFFGTDLAAFTNLLPNGKESFDAFFNARALGDFTATYTLNLSDADLSGATNLGPLTLTLTGTTVVPEPVMLSIAATAGLMMLRRRRMA